MELYQVRYFLALTKTLNFTRAAEECNVSQPALSRAILQLEAELGGDLFRRERNLTHMTELGHSVLPALRQCFESSLSAKTLAKEFLKEGHAPLNLALSRTIEMQLLSPMLSELASGFPRLDINIFRGSPPEIAERLKGGESEIAVAGTLEEGWDRLDAKKLFQQQFGLLLSARHPLSDKDEVELEDLKDERLLTRSCCAHADAIIAKVRERGSQRISKHEVPAVDDLPALVAANFGVGIWPVARKVDMDLKVSHIHGVDMSRWINVYTVAGRQRTAAAAALTGLLRAKDWPEADEATAQ